MTTAVHSLALTDLRQEAPPRIGRIAWPLFLLLNATLFMRPAEIVPELEGLPIYNVIILLCVASSIQGIIQKLQTRWLATSPITVCVLGMLPAIVLSHLSHGETWYAREHGIDFVKVIVYYLLLITLVDSPRRLRQFMLALAIYALGLTTVALLRYSNVIQLDTIQPMVEVQPDIDPVTRKHLVAIRLVAAGIYGNPNDLARIIVIGITICLFGLMRKVSLRRRAVWMIPLAVFGRGLQLTYSRGGLLALMASLVVLFHARFGTKKGAAAILLLLPALAIFGGRQTDISTSHGTGQLRIQLWSAGLVAMRSSPVFGIGMGMYKEVAGNHAHNSFVETYVETGFLGGSFFTCAAYLATVALYRLKSDEMQSADPELWRLRPYVLSLVVGSIVGQFSSARGYALPTYMILALASAYLSLAAQRTPASVVRVSPRLVVRMAMVSAAALFTLHLYTKLNANFN